jgi:hypothetical protein
VQVVSEPDVRPQQQEDQGLIQRNSFPPHHHLIFLFLLPLVAVAGGISPSADSLLSRLFCLFSQELLIFECTLVAHEVIRCDPRLVD